MEPASSEQVLQWSSAILLVSASVRNGASLHEICASRAVIFYSTGTRQNHIFSNVLQPSIQFERTLLRKKEGCLCCCVVLIVHRRDKDKAQNTQQEDDLR
jgi:hypothetical protein